MLVGLAAWVYRVVWRDMIRRGRIHRVANIDLSGDTITVELEPVGKPLSYNVGQFAFLKIHAKGMREPHPFTIASSPNESVLRFVIKDLGDWTSRVMERLSVGDRVTVEGPYGALQPFPSYSTDEVLWIAGGVGITLFLGAACSRDPGQGPTPHLFFCIRSHKNAPRLAELERAAAEGRIHLHVHCSEENNRLTGSHIENVVGRNGLRSAHVVMCGPNALIKSMRPAVRALGARHIDVEGFDIRTGLGPDLSRQIAQLIGAVLRRNNATHRESARPA